MEFERNMVNEALSLNVSHATGGEISTLGTLVEAYGPKVFTC